ncbi:HlyD family secretion protein [Thalassoglobus sp. JC818]|uniref:HlyD family secretion protein n=1 Tax=Thalassoglobus sp. JC818 TaxID=3232136 RepID=UPI0034581AD7
MGKRKQFIPKLATLGLLLVGLGSAYLLYQQYQSHPWTRDGQVRADLVRIAPRVGGYLVNVNVTDNQFVRKGDLLFRIDPSSYQLAVDNAEVALDEAREAVAALEASVKAAEAMVKQRETSVDSAKSRIVEAQSSIESAEATIKESEAGVTSARALVERTKALLEEAKREAARARRLADQKAGSEEIAEAKAASVNAFLADLEIAKAGEVKALATLAKTQVLRNEANARLAIAKDGLAEAHSGVITARAELQQTRATLGEPGDGNVRIRNARVKLEEAKLNLSWTEIFAPNDGYITNMDLLSGTFVTPGTPFALFVDSTSFRVDGYFQETKLKKIQPGDRALITLMGHQERRLEGEVESIGYAINPPNLANTEGPDNLVPTIAPTFEWIRLAQRVPVRIRLKEIPDDLHLVAGTTASVSIQQ